MGKWLVRLAVFGLALTATFTPVGSLKADSQKQDWKERKRPELKQEMPQTKDSLEKKPVNPKWQKVEQNKPVQKYQHQKPQKVVPKWHEDEKKVPGYVHKEWKKENHGHHKKVEHANKPKPKYPCRTRCSHHDRKHQNHHKEHVHHHKPKIKHWEHVKEWSPCRCIWLQKIHHKHIRSSKHFKKHVHKVKKGCWVKVKKVKCCHWQKHNHKKAVHRPHHHHYSCKWTCFKGRGHHYGWFKWKNPHFHFAHHNWIKIVWLRA